MRTTLEILRCARANGSDAMLWTLEGYRFEPHRDAATALARSFDRLHEMGKIVVQVLELPNEELPPSFGIVVQE